MTLPNNPKDFVYNSIHKVTGKPVDSIQPNDLLTSLVTDSIQLFELILELENAFAIEPDYDELVKIQTVQQAVEFVEKIYVTQPTQ